MSGTALTVGLVSLLIAIILYCVGRPSAFALSLIGTAFIAGMIAIAAAIQHTRYQDRL